MTKAKHTPGPWQAIASVPAEGFEAYWIKAQPHPAMRGFTREIASVNGPQNEENEATARLVAAAPDLLDALKAILVGAENDEHSGDDLLWTTYWRNAVEQARAAISKATVITQDQR